MLNYKNSELTTYQNIINKLKNNNNNNKSTKNNDLILQNVQMQINNMRAEITGKNKIIDSLKKKITKFNEDYNRKILELKQNSNENINQTQEQIEQLIIERDELLRKNDNLTKGLLKFNDLVKEVDLRYNAKTENYNKNIMAFKEKMKEFATKIKILKKKNMELSMIIKNAGINYTNNLCNMDSISLYNMDNMNSNEKLLIRGLGSPSFLSQKNNNYCGTDSRKNIKHNEINFKTYERESDSVKRNIAEDQLDKSQKKYLDDYKKYLSGLDGQLNK
jgi:phage host-nuclease inhibitor protein Gam